MRFDLGRGNARPMTPFMALDRQDGPRFMNRILKETVNLDPRKVAEFFEQRAARFLEEAPYSSILYQDKNPELAIERDRHEKSTIAPMLQVNNTTRILDIGCGIGRWAEVLADRAADYVGLDISPKLIELARKRVKLESAYFLVGGTEDIKRADVATHGPFDLVIMSGIMIYLNDDMLHDCFRSLADNVAPGGRIYMREPLALGDRLTLSEYWSSELNQHYSAIYRTAEELQEIFCDTLYPAKFETVRFEQLYSDARHNNRRETVQHFAIARRA